MAGSVARGIKLDDVRCIGDESRVCCDLPAFGASVIAVGKLVRAGWLERYGIEWSLKDVRLCTEDTPQSATRVRDAGVER